MEIKSLHRGDCVRLRSGVVVDVARLIEENKRLRAENERLRYRGDGPLVREDGIWFCETCGAEVSEIDRYCPSCGIKFEGR